MLVKNTITNYLFQTIFLLLAVPLLLATENDQKSMTAIPPGPPVFARQMQHLMEEPAGNRVTLKCKAVGNPEPNITWYKDGESPRRQLGDIRVNHWSLVMEDLITDDKGNYTCVVCNVHGCINHTTILDVNRRYHNPPILTKGLKNTTVALGSNITLSCNFVSDLNPFIQWTKMGENKSWVQIQLGSVTPEIYEIQNVTVEDEGWYACVAANSLGRATSKGYLEVVESIDEEVVSVKTVDYMYLMISNIFSNHFLPLLRVSTRRKWKKDECLQKFQIRNPILMDEESNH